MNYEYNKDLSKSEIQAVWDKCLVDGASHGVKMWRVIGDFMSNIGCYHKDYNYHWFEDGGVHFLESLELRRCRDRDAGGDLRFRAWKDDALSFIGARCMPLQLAIVNSRVDNDEVLATLAAYKWVRRNYSIKKSRNRGASWRRLPLIDLSKKHDWSTVK